MRREFSRQSHPEYPPSNEVHAAVLEHFKTKQELESAWARRNAPSFQEKLQHQFELLLSATIARVIVRMLLQPVPHGLMSRIQHCHYPVTTLTATLTVALVMVLTAAMIVVALTVTLITAPTQTVTTN